MGFVVLPDHPVGLRVAAVLARSGYLRIVRHDSGRPWVVGDWRDGEVRTVCRGARRLVVLGATGVRDGVLFERLGRVDRVAALDVVAAALPGSFHLVGSVGGVLRVQGSLSTVRQVFHGTVDGMAVAADRPDVIARLARSGVDTTVLVLRLLCPYGPPAPLTDTCVWSGVRAVPPDCYLRVDRDGTRSAVPWWRPPDPTVPLADAAEDLCETLAVAVAARRFRQPWLSADLSGGLDSTSLCYLAARGGDLTTVHYEPMDHDSADGVWARRCASDLPTADHVVVGSSSASLWYAAQQDAEPDLEGPFPFDRSRPTVAHLAVLLAGRGLTRHLHGAGSDELFSRSRHSPDPVRPYGDWLTKCADELSRPWSYEDAVEWEVPPKLPPWVTPDAVAMVRDVLRDAASRAEPMAARRDQHEALRLVRFAGTVARRTARVAERSGVALEAPYLDDRVLGTGLALRLEDQTQPKSVLRAAMRGVVPDGLLDREDKGAATHEMWAWRRHADELLDLCADSRLAQLGLVRPNALRSALRGSTDGSSPPMPFGSTRSCELWLRAVEATVPSTRRKAEV